MSIYSNVRSAIRAGTVKVFENIGLPNTPVIYSHQNGAEPDESYVVVNPLFINQNGRTQESTMTDDGDEFGQNKNLWYISHYEVMTQFTFTGPEAPVLANEFLHAVNNNRVVIEEYQKNNLSPLRKTNLRRSPQKRDTQWIEFLTIDVTFSYAVRTIQPIDWVEKVVLVDAISGETFTVPPTPPTP